MSEESKEFRNVHSAKFYLNIYVERGRDLRVIRNIPIDEIGRFDVWQCVFEKEPEAYRELCVKEWYNDNLKSSDNDDVNKFRLEFSVYRLIQLEEWNTSFTVQDAIKIIFDCYGTECLPFLIEKAEKCVESRKEIVKPYYKPDNEWVGFAERVLEKLKQYERHYTEKDH